MKKYFNPQELERNLPKAIRENPDITWLLMTAIPKNKDGSKTTKQPYQYSHRDGGFDIFCLANKLFERKFYSFQEVYNEFMFYKNITGLAVNHMFNPVEFELISFVLPQKPLNLTFIDFDDVVFYDENGKRHIDSDILEWLRKIGGYIELSFGGNGIHCLVPFSKKISEQKTNLPPYENKELGRVRPANALIELYDVKKLVSCTGITLNKNPEVAFSTANLSGFEKIQEFYFSEKEIKRLERLKPVSQIIPSQDNSIFSVATEFDVFRILQKSEFGRRTLNFLKNGYPEVVDKSNIDIEVFGGLAWASNRNVNLMISIFEKSNIWPSKRRQEKSKNYLINSANIAISNCRKTYAEFIYEQQKNSKTT